MEDQACPMCAASSSVVDVDLYARDPAAFLLRLCRPHWQTIALVRSVVHEAMQARERDEQRAVNGGRHG